MALCRRQGLEYPAWHWSSQLITIAGGLDGSLGAQVVCRHVGREFMHLLFVLKGAKSHALSRWPSFWETVGNMFRFVEKMAFIIGGAMIRRCHRRFLLHDSRQLFQVQKLRAYGSPCCFSCAFQVSYDGSWSLDALSARFSSRGYRVLMMTEHDPVLRRIGWPVSSGVFRCEFRQDPGDAWLEYSDATNRVHVLCGPRPFLGEGLPTGEMLEAVKAASGLAVLAHPSRREAWKSFEPTWADRCWESKSGIGSMTAGAKWTAPALLATSGAIPFVGLDFHTVRQSFRWDGTGCSGRRLGGNSARFLEIAPLRRSSVWPSVEPEHGSQGPACPERGRAKQTDGASLRKYSRELKSDVRRQPNRYDPPRSR